MAQTFSETISRDRVRQDLEELIFAVHGAFEDAPRQAKEFFEGQNRKVDQFLVNDLIRYYVKQYLIQFAFDVTEDYGVNDLPNNGLSVGYKGYQVRILKADKGDLPVPNSDKKIEFYSQQLSLDSLLDEQGNVIYALKPNVLILWELTGSYDFSRLYLACPKTGGRTRESVTAHFNEAIEHLAYSLRSEKAATESLEQDEVHITRLSAEEIQHSHDEIDEINDIRRENKTSS